MTWDRDARGVLELPSGRLVRGRALRRPPPDGPAPQFGVYLLGRAPEPQPWPSRWVRWPDLRLPSDQADAVDALREALARCGSERVEVACTGGKGRTGTALACLAVLDGAAPEQAFDLVRRRYHPGAVETPWQRRWIRRFPH